MELREYQREAVDAIYQYFEANTGNPLIVMPTASGKSFVMAAFIHEVLDVWPDQRILILTHVKELIQQDYSELVEHWPLAPAGIYSAGLQRRDANAQVLFAGIQSIHNRGHELGAFDLILIDECHLVPRKSDTMYRRFLDDMVELNKHVKIIGFTATHYRLDSGLLTEGSDRIFTDIAYEIPVRRLIDEGYLSPLVTKAPGTKLDVSGVHLRGGEFIHSELQAAVDKEDVNLAAVREIIRYGYDRKSWLVFCTGVQHAEKIRDVLRKNGVVTETITGSTNLMEREFILQSFKDREVQAITNCDILTTGFNHPGIDLLAIIRPTQSTGLYVQMAGRGMRTTPGKKDCLVLDFARNIERHGPIDRVKPIRPGQGNGEAPVKTCPKCHSVIFAGFRICPDCQYEFPAPQSELKPTASSKAIISENKPTWVMVQRIRYSRYSKPGKPDSLKVDYHEGYYTRYSEWVCLEHDGFAAKKARQWWRRMGGDPSVATVHEALKAADQLKVPTAISVKEEGKFWRIVSHRFEETDLPTVEIDADEMGYDQDADYARYDDVEVPF